MKALTEALTNIYIKIYIEGSGIAGSVNRCMSGGSHVPPTLPSGRQTAHRESEASRVKGGSNSHNQKSAEGETHS